MRRLETGFRGALGHEGGPFLSSFVQDFAAVLDAEEIPLPLDVPDRQDNQAALLQRFFHNAEGENRHPQPGFCAADQGQVA